MNILIYTHSWFPFISGVTIRYKQIVDGLKSNNNIILINPYSNEKYDGIRVIKIKIIKNKFLPVRECRVQAFRYDIPRKIYKMTNSCDDLLHTWN